LVVGPDYFLSKSGEVADGQGLTAAGLTAAGLTGGLPHVTADLLCYFALLFKVKKIRPPLKPEIEKENHDEENRSFYVVTRLGSKLF
jgi:hypothetical protein